MYKFFLITSVKNLKAFFIHVKRTKNKQGI